VALVWESESVSQLVDYYIFHVMVNMDNVAIGVTGKQVTPGLAAFKLLIFNRHQ
jgi:hypothetical protein